MGSPKVSLPTLMTLINIFQEFMKGTFYTAALFFFFRELLTLAIIPRKSSNSCCLDVSIYVRVTSLEQLSVAEFSGE